MNVLFVSDTRFVQAPYRDGSTRYRCYHMAEGLQAAGYVADVTTLATLNLSNLSRYDVISVHHPIASRKLLAVLERAQKLSIRTVADVDALEFDPALAAESPKSRAKSTSLASVRASFMRHSLALAHFDEVCVATDELARARRAIAPSQPVFVAPNGLSNYWLDSHDQLELKQPEQLRIGFFTERSHMSIEFAQAVKAIDTFLKSSVDSELYLQGPLTIPARQLPDDQLIRGPWKDFIDMPDTIAQCWCTVSPHQPSNINYAQPHTKFIEAAAFGVPTISSPTAQLLEHDVPGLSIAENNEQFLQSLNLLSDKTYHQKCQTALYEYVRDCCLATHSANILIRQWSAKLEKPTNETFTRLSAAS